MHGCNIYKPAVFGLLVAVCSIPALAAAAEAPAPDAAAEPAATATRERLPEEITVTGQKLFSTLHKQIREAEDRMYGLFNELNSDNLYDVHCEWEAPLGTRIRQRNCRPNFFLRASEENAQAYLAQLRGEPGANVIPVNAQLAFHYPILEQKMKALVAENPELLDAVLRHYELQQELDARKSSYFGDD